MKHTNINSYLSGLSVKNKLQACNLLLTDYLLISADTNGLQGINIRADSALERMGEAIAFDT